MTKCRMVGGDGAKNSTTAEPAAKKIFMGIERKGKELGCQISGEVRKLVGGSEKTGKVATDPKTFLPRLERRDPEKVQGNSPHGRGDSDASTWKRCRRDDHSGMNNEPEGKKSEVADSKRVREHTETITINDMKGKESSRRFNLDTASTKGHNIQMPAPPRPQQAKERKSDEPNRYSRHPVQKLTNPSQTVIATRVRHSEPVPGNPPTLHPPQSIEWQSSSHNINDSTPPQLSGKQSLSKPLGLDSVPPTEPSKYNKSGNSYPQPNQPTNLQIPSTEPSPVELTVAAGKIVTSTQVAYERDMNDNLPVKTPTPSALDFWAEADSTLSLAHARSYGQYYHHGNSFWAEADKAVPLPPWKRGGPSLEKWIAGLPSAGDGARDSKFFGAGNKLKKRTDKPEAGVLRVVNGNAENDDKILFDEDGNEVIVKVDKGFLHSSPQTDSSTLQVFPHSFQAGRLEILLEASLRMSYK